MASPALAAVASRRSRFLLRARVSIPSFALENNVEGVVCASLCFEASKKASVDDGNSENKIPPTGFYRIPDTLGDAHSRFLDISNSLLYNYPRAHHVYLIPLPNLIRIRIRGLLRLVVHARPKRPAFALFFFLDNRRFLNHHACFIQHVAVLIRDHGKFLDEFLLLAI